jgi:trehalose 6-phosphate synthase/phosphatase
VSRRASHARSRLVVVSNRLPYSFSRSGRRWRADPASGGLVTALLPVLRHRGGTWIGWTGASGPAGELRAAMRSAATEAGYRLAPVTLTEAEVRDFYLGFSNEVLWPLFHDLPSLCRFEPAYWRAYQAVNRKYARAAHRRAGAGDFIWVHDYQLMTTGAELRRLGTAARVGFFLHIPFPAPDLFMKLPWRAPLLAALLEYDLLGFQSSRDLRNFAACAQALGRAVRTESRGTVLVGAGARGAARAGHFPISIDYNAFMRRAAASDVAERARELHRLLPKRKLVLGIDRLDYTKGITLRLRAFQDLLERHPEMRGRLSLIQVVVPSREQIPQYERMKSEVEQLVGRINGAFARPGGWVPVWYEYRSLSRLDLLAYYRAADIALITPLKDGMNLVAKEYCACSIGEDCVLILSEFAGAAEQLAGGALLVNPHDIRGVADALRAAHDMPRAARIARMRGLRRSIRRNDVFRWVDDYLRAAAARDLAAFSRPGSDAESALAEQLPV